MQSLFDQMLESCTTHAELIFSGTECSREGALRRYRAGTFHYVRSGQCALEVAGQARQLIEAPALIFFPGDSLHRVYAANDVGAGLSCAVVSFSESFTRSVVRSFPDYAVVSLREASSFLHAVNAFFGEADGAADNGHQLANRLGDVVVCYLTKTLAQQQRLRPCPKPCPSHPGTKTLAQQQRLRPGLMAALLDPRIAAAVSSIHNRYAQDLDVDSLATEACMSRSRFVARFRELLDTSPHQYLLHHRMDMARQMLRKGLPVKTVAERVGYSSLSAFVRQFRSVVGQSPGAWAK